MILTIIIFIAVLSVLVFAHEAGHFYVAKWFGLKPEEFGWGMPPRAWGIYRKKGGGWKTVKGNKKVEDADDTIYSVNWLPIGGFVKLGEDDSPVDINDNHFNNKPPYQRAAILAAGVTMNVILAAALLGVGYMFGLPQAVDENISPRAEVSDVKVQILEVLANSPAERAGLELGDTVRKIDGQVIERYQAMQKIVDDNQDNELEFVIGRGPDELIMKITPELREEIGRGGIGVAITETGLVRYPFFIAIWQGIKAAFVFTWLILLAFASLLKGLIMGQGMGVEVAGPIGIAAMTGQVARQGFVYLLQFSAVLSINLAIINALPFPALDGGRILFLFIEKIKGSPVKKEIEGTIHYIGFALLMLLILVVTFKDVFKHSSFVQMMVEKIF